MMQLLSSALLPPLNLLLLATVGAVVMRWRPRLGRALMAVALIGGYVLSMPVISRGALRHLESQVAYRDAGLVEPARSANLNAIVVLGGGSYFNAPEYRQDTVSEGTLQRLRWAARLHKQLQLPLLVSGGSPYGSGSSEAEQMQQALMGDFGVPVRWAETRSKNTYESARRTRAMLGEQRNRIVLVTHASHMPRALLAFRSAGFEVIPAATAFTTSPPASLRSFLPSASGLTIASTFFHEVIGIGWYHLRLALAVDPGREGASGS